MTDLAAASKELVDALRWSREHYVPSARNAPDPMEVRANKEARLRAAEEAVRALLDGEAPTAVERSADLLDDARALAADVTAQVDEAFDVNGLVSLWRNVKEAANRLYATCKTVEPHIITADPQSRGWHNDGRPVEMKRRFEVELLDDQAFTAWLASLPEDRRKDAEVEWRPKLNRTATELVKKAVREDGEIPAGVSAGDGNPFLALGKGS